MEIKKEIDKTIVSICKDLQKEGGLAHPRGTERIKALAELVDARAKLKNYSASSCAKEFETA